MCGAVDNVRRQYIEAHELQYAAMNRSQNTKNVSIEAALAIGLLGPSGGEGEESSSASEETRLVDVAAAVGALHGENTIHPAFESGRKAEPPQRKLPHHEVTPLKLLEFRFDLFREAMHCSGIRFLGLQFEERWLLDGAEVLAARDRVERHSMKVGRENLVSRLRKSVARCTEHRCVEAKRLRVPIDDEYFHESVLVVEG